MNEMALRVTDKIFQDFSTRIDATDNNKVSLYKRTIYNPKGGLQSVWTDTRIRAKWVEVVCDLLSPQKRDQFTPGLIANCGFTTDQIAALVSVWTNEKRNQWLGIAKQKDKKEKKKQLDDLWADIVPEQIIADVGTDSTGTVNKTDAVIWSDADKMDYLIVCNDDVGNPEDLIGYEDSEVDGTAIKKQRYKINWETDIGLTETEKGNVRNPAIIVQPIYDRPVAFENIVYNDDSVIPVKTGEQWKNILSQMEI